MKIFIFDETSKIEDVTSVIKICNNNPSVKYHNKLLMYWSEQFLNNKTYYDFVISYLYIAAVQLVANVKQGQSFAIVEKTIWMQNTLRYVLDG